MSKDGLSALLKILERMPVPCVIASPITGRVLWVNSQLVEFARAPGRERLVGRSVLEFIQPGQQGVALADLASVAVGKRPAPVIYELVRTDGSRASAHISSVPIMYENQPGMLSLVTDVSERERLIRDLEESEERYRFLVEAAPAGVVVVVKGEIVFANAAFARALGLEGQEDLVGRSMYDFIAPEHVDAERAARRGVVRTGKTTPASPIELLRSDGRRVATTFVTLRTHWDGHVATQTLMHEFAGAWALSRDRAEPLLLERGHGPVVLDPL